MDIPVTRACIDGILNGSIEKSEMRHNDRFNLEVPTHVDGVDDKLLWPRNTWADKDEYDRVAKKLAGKFVEHFKQFQVPGLPDYSPYGPHANCCVCWTRVESVICERWSMRRQLLFTK